MAKKYEKPELKIHGDLEKITKSNHIKGIDGSDMQGSTS